MKNNHKQAFTIAEALITFSLIGIIFVLGVKSINIRPNNNYNKLYWQAFNTLYQASKAYQSEWAAKSIENCTCNYDPDQMDCYRAECWRNSTIEHKCSACKNQERNYLGGTKNIDRKFPGFLFDESISNALAGRGQDEEFCEKLISRINTFPSGRCKSFISVANPAVIKNSNSQGGKKFTEAFTYATENEDGTFEQIYNEGGISPSFIALNGQKFYISSVVTANSPKALGTAWNNFGKQERESYRFVVVDLNGDSKPNSQFKTNSMDPDTVLFAITSMGDVIPLGLPEFTKTYINASVYYPNDLNDDGTRMYPDIKSKPMTLWEAKSYAWSNETCGGGSNQLPYGSAVSDNEPLSQSAKFYAVAAYCKGNTKNCANKNARKTAIYADSLFTNLVLQFLFKAENSTELYPYLTQSECIYNSKENGCEAITSVSETPTCAIDFEH